MKQLEVQIMGQSYLLSCPDGGEVPLLESVERVDTAMCKIRDAGKVRARERIAVLAALNLAFEMSGRSVAVPLAQVQTGKPSEQVHQADENQLLVSLLERLDVALIEDGQLI